jgi:hypothetical protein
VAGHSPALSRARCLDRFIYLSDSGRICAFGAGLEGTVSRGEDVRVGAMIAATIGAGEAFVSARRLA